MKYLFQVRFLLGMIALLLLVLYLQSEANAANRLGGPVEIAYAQGYAHHLLWLGLRGLVSGVVVPCGIGLLVYGYCRWRHPADRVRVGRALLLPTLVVWAWGLLGAVALTFIPSDWKLYYLLVMLVLEVGLAIAAARVGYEEGRAKMPSGAGTGQVNVPSEVA
jgi:hypothetical protein